MNTRLIGTVRVMLVVVASASPVLPGPFRCWCVSDSGRGLSWARACPADGVTATEATIATVMNSFENLFFGHFPNIANLLITNRNPVKEMERRRSIPPCVSYRHLREL